MNKLRLLTVVTLLVSLMACNAPKIKVACVGDSITEGYGLAVPSKTGYPVVLNQLLGENYSVINSGRSGTTALKESNFPFWICKEFSNVFAFEPNIIVIKLGTNDTKPQNWNESNYELDYQALIDTFNTIAPHPKIYLCKPVPVFKTRWGINDSTVVNSVLPVLEKLAKQNQLEIIDLYQGLLNQGANFPDSIHPNEQAVAEMAAIIAKSIKK